MHETKQFLLISTNKDWMLAVNDNKYELIIFVLKLTSFLCIMECYQIILSVTVNMSMLGMNLGLWSIWRMKNRKKKVITGTQSGRSYWPSNSRAALTTLLALIPNISMRTVGGPERGIWVTASFFTIMFGVPESNPATASPIPPENFKWGHQFNMSNRFKKLLVKIFVYILHTFWVMILHSNDFASDSLSVLNDGRVQWFNSEWIDDPSANASLGQLVGSI